MKTSKNVFVGATTVVFGLSVLVGGSLFAVPARAAFPADQAGLAAYVKLDGVTQANFNNALSNFFDYAEPSGDTYMIGVKGYSANNNYSGGKINNQIDIHFYLGVDGWLAAYLSKDDPVAKIVNWGDGAELDDTLLRVALEDAIAKIGGATTQTIQYYDFSSPASLKMTLVKESSPVNAKDARGNSVNYNEFSAMTQGSMNRFSWSVAAVGTSCGGWAFPINLSIDGSSIGGGGCSSFTYGNYSPVIFNDQKSHIVKIGKTDYFVAANGVFVFIYGN